MFNLDELEKNWQEYYRTKYGKDHLSDEEILEIYKSENATIEYYNMKKDQYGEYFYKLWEMVPNSVEDRLIARLHDCDYRLGWEEDISNIDKEKFLQEYIDEYNKEKEDEKRRIADWYKKVDLQIQIQNLPSDDYFETHTPDIFGDDDLVISIFKQKEEEKKNRPFIEAIYQKEEEERQKELDERISAESNYDLSCLHELFAEDLETLDISDNTDEESFNDIVFEQDDKDYSIPYRKLYADDIFDEYKNYDIEPPKEDTREEYQEKIRRRNIATRIIMEKSQIEEPKKLHLSPEKQKEVVEGCMHLVFDQTRYWDEATGHVFDLEEIYYLCLYALIRSAKYCCHCQKPVFPLLVYEYIRRDMYNLIGKRMHLTYRELYQKMEYYELEHEPINDDDHQLYDIPEKEESPEILTDPKEIYLMIKDIPSDEEYQKESDAFMEAYYQELSKLSGYERSIMSMSYDNNGYPGLTNKEIAENLVIDDKQVSHLKSKLKKKIKKDIIKNIL